MMSTTVLENKIEMLGRRLTDVMSAMKEATPGRFRIGTRYRLKCDIESEKGFVEGDIVRAVALKCCMVSDVVIFSERSEEALDFPLAILDGWVRAGALEEV